MRIRSGFLLVALCSAFMVAARGGGAQVSSGAECVRLPMEMDRAIDTGDFVTAAVKGEQLFSRCTLAGESLDRMAAEFAGALGETGRNEKALAVAEQCVSRQPRSPHCLLQKGVMLGRLGRPAAAQQAFQAALRFGATPAELAELRREPAQPASDRRQATAPPSSSGGPGNDKTGMAGHGKSGSGFFINANGNIITNAHVVAGCGHVETSDRMPLKIIATNAPIDIAVLQAEHGPPEIAALRSVPAPRVGEDVLAFGFPLPGLLSTEGNVTVGILSADRGIGDDPHVFQITAPVQSGNSGGPLVDAAGNVIGVIVSKLDAGKVAQRLGDLPQNVNFAIKAIEVINILDKLKISYSPGKLGEHQNSADLAAATKKFSVQIICF